MAAKLSDLGDRTSGANLQMKGHVGVPCQSAEALGSSPSCLPSWSPARRPPSGCTNIRYCLKICVTLTKELGAVSLPSHSWTAPLVEDRLCDVRIGLTEAVVTGPGRPVLFYGKHSLGEGLTMEWNQGCCIPTHWSGYVGWETSLPCHWPHNNSGRSMGDCSSCNRLPSKGRRTGASTCKYINPTIL